MILFRQNLAKGPSRRAPRSFSPGLPIISYRLRRESSVRPDPSTALHIVVDMQELFRSHPEWGTQALTGIVPPIQRC
jgi:hypothetical protein